MQLPRWQLVIVAVLAAVALILTITNIVIQTSNRSLQAEVNQGQRFINQSIQISQLNNQLINTLAGYAAQANDAAITGLLNANGVSFTITQPNAADQATTQPATEPTANSDTPSEEPEGTTGESSE